MTELQIPKGHVQVEVLKPFNGWLVGSVPIVKAADAAKWAEPGRDLVRVLVVVDAELDPEPEPQRVSDFMTKALDAPPQDKRVKSPKAAK